MTPSGLRHASQRRARWRMSIAVGEGLRNWYHGRWLTVLLTVFISAVLTMPALVDGIAVARMIEEERAWVAAGGRMLVVTNDDGEGIPRAACESAARISGIAATVALTRLPSRVGFANAPDSEIPVVAAGEGIGPVLGLAGSTGAVLPEDVAEALGVEVGDRVHLTELATSDGDGVFVTQEAVPVGAISDTTVLGEEYAYAVLLPTSAVGMARTCLVRVEPGFVESVRSALPTLLASGGLDGVVADRLIGGEFARDFADEYASRGLRHAPWSVGAAVSLVWLLITWVRRGRDGLYATVGADGPTRAVIRTAEGFALLGTSAAVSAGVVTIGLVLATHDLGMVAQLAARHLVVATSVSVVGVVLSTAVPLRSPLAALKDR